MTKKFFKKDFAKDIVKKIQKEWVKQTPRYIFVLKHTSVIFFFILSIIIWAISISISSEYLLDADWNLFHRIWFFRLALIFMPFFWILFLFASSVLAYFNFKHTERWYKFNFLQILWINVFLSLFVAVIMYFSWVNDSIEKWLENTIPKYRQVFVEDKMSRMKKIWQNEDAWMLMWKIFNLNSWSIDLVDLNNQNWYIITSSWTIIHRPFSHWDMIKIIWENNWEYIFEAFEIRPLKWDRMMKKNRF